MSIVRTLFIDADDTLWENNIYYERVIDEFTAALCARGVEAARVRQTLWETEQRNIRITGYGSNAFCQSLHEVARAFGVTDLEPQIQRWQEFIFHHPVELMPGVRETIPLLHAHNRLVLLTRGCDHEQTAKLQRSGLASYFSGSEVVFEKSVQTYRSLLAKHGVPASHAWMIGNSPRFDINPAKAAGLGTVWIPYHTPWQHEIEEIATDGPPTLVLETFAELARYFGPTPHNGWRPSSLTTFHP